MINLKCDWNIRNDVVTRHLGRVRRRDRRTLQGLDMTNGADDDQVDHRDCTRPPEDSTTLARPIRTRATMYSYKDGVDTATFRTMMPGRYGASFVDHDGHARRLRWANDVEFPPPH